MSWRVVSVVLIFVCVASCKGPNGPSPTAVRITEISPAVGSTFGGTAVTISGEGFGAGTVVTLGGAQATDVVVLSGNTITAKTAQHSAAVVDVTVDVSGRSASLVGSFTYLAPDVGNNAPPVIENILIHGLRANQPANMADLNELIQVNALVSNAEVMPSALTYEWSATSGTFEGTGQDVFWHAPATLATPRDETITLTVVEPYFVPTADGLPERRENRTTRTAIVRVHNSPREISDLAEDFLDMFSDSTISPTTVIGDFSDRCAGRAAELVDVRRNRCVYTINSSRILEPDTPTINFGGVCPVRGRRADACTAVGVRWESTINAEANACPVELIGQNTYTPGQVEKTEGVDYVTAVYDRGRWRLCDSDFIGEGGQTTSFKK